ncbi:MAG TPA: biopolymer transporter ExbD [Chitinophagaceae bacterium]|nr:biopolymer transporter ExbD [Chitinophagaceae bacterium]
MALIETNARERRGKTFVHNKKQLLRIDMTPMVDLGFLLITFFVFTTTISTPTVTDLFMPRDESIIDPQKLPKSLALTLLLNDRDKICYYHGDIGEAIKTNEIFETSYSTFDGIGKVIRKKQKDIDASGKFKDGRRGMMIVIKPGSGSVYKNVVDALDEVMINDVKKYAIVEPGDAEMKFLKSGSWQ